MPCAHAKSGRTPLCRTGRRLGTASTALLAVITAEASAGTDLVVYGNSRYDSRIFEQRFVAIEAGALHTVVLRADGTAVAWGMNWGGRCRVEDWIGLARIGGGVVSSVGYKQGAVADIAGAAPWANARELNCLQVDWNPNATSGSVYPSANGAAFLNADGTVRCRGNNAFGEATPPVGLTGVVAVAQSKYGTAAVRSDGQVVFWGETGVAPPAGVGPLEAIKGGVWHFLARRPDGTLTAWGYQAQAVVPPALGPVRDFDTGYWHNAAVRADGQVVCWGLNDAGQCNVPTDLGPVARVACGQAHTAVLRANGTVAAWGANNELQLGFPVPAAGFRRVVNSESRWVFLSDDGIVTTMSFPDGSPPADLLRVTDIAARRHVMALQADQTVRCWGRNVDGECNVPAGLGQVRAISAGDGFSAALRTNDTVVMWGRNDIEQCNVPPTLGPVAEISCGKAHTVALLRNGRVKCWGGLDASNELGAPFATNYIQVRAGDYHSVALCSDGTVRCWGENLAQQCNAPADLGFVVAVAAGPFHTSALSSTGRVVTWGLGSGGRNFEPWSPQLAPGVVGIDAGYDRILCHIARADPLACPADLTNDRQVDGTDLGILLSMWGPHAALNPADINRDGTVDGADLGLLFERWGMCQ